jgi:predicted RNase H-like HicB family nuclease
MLTKYIHAALARARYELLEDGRYYGEIKLCPGVWAQGNTLETCREELQEVLEEWLVLKIRDRNPIPAIGGTRPYRGTLQTAKVA